MRALYLAAAALVCLLGFASNPVAASTPRVDDPTEGQLRAVDAKGNLRPPCPLEHTGVDVDVSGLVARVTVTQRFVNPYQEAIEAVYLFPLSADAAVDRMSMRIGDRTITGRIARRPEARAAYESARAEGRTASLLEQERPNVFTQSVANIPPGARVVVTISYVETLDYEDGRVEFVFPMVVGQRYTPAAATAARPDATATSTAMRQGTRAGHDVSIDVRLDAGVPFTAVDSKLHAIETSYKSHHAALIRLAARDEIPNRDFILSWDVAGGRLEDAVLAHRDQRGGFVTLLLQPPDRIAEVDLTPNEIVFVVDTSGSMSGLPMEKAKETVRYAIERLSPGDTFNVITFSGSTRVLFPDPVPASAANREAAMKLLAETQGGGGTEMMTAIRAALEPSDAQHHVRIACFVTDGYVGNESEILAEIQKHPQARVFAIGIGNAVNRYLLDQMAAEGRGEVIYATLIDDGEPIAHSFFDRVRNPILTDVTIDWNGLPVTDVLPQRIPDVFSARPVVVAARYSAPASGTIRIRGFAGGREVVREVAVILPESTAGTDSLATLWARRKVAEVSREDFAGLLTERPRPTIDGRIAELGLEFGLLTPFTSFVAVDETSVSGNGEPKRVDVATEAPDGVEGRALDGMASAKSGGVTPPALPVEPEPGAVYGSEAGFVAEYGDSSGSVVAGDAASPDLSTVVERKNLTTSPEPVIDESSRAGSSDIIEAVTIIGSGAGAESDGRPKRRPVADLPPRQPNPTIAPGAGPATPWRRVSARPAVEIVFAIDTTGSMGSLLDGARRRIWSMINEIQRTGCRPEVRIGLVAFRDRGDTYETMILPLTTDLDLVWVTLSGLTPSGGGDTPENVQRALSDAVGTMGWSKAEAGPSKVVFLVGDAPPQEYEDEAKIQNTVRAAFSQGIVVHAIQCGDDGETKRAWTEIALLGAGNYFPIPADSTVAASSRTPYDRVIADLGRRIGETYTPYGTPAAQEAANARQSDFELRAAGRDNRAVAADRAINKAVNSGAYAGDFLQAIENGELKLESVAQSDLPQELRGLSPRALRAEIDRRISERQGLRAAIVDLARLRDSYQSRTATDAADPVARFDTAVVEAVRKQIEKFGMPCE